MGLHGHILALQSEVALAPTTMRPHCVLLLLLLVQVTTGEQQMLIIYKCCEPFEVLSGDGQSCVEAPWQQDPAPWHDDHLYGLWVSRWLPPGLSLGRVDNAVTSTRGVWFKRPFVRAVNSSAEWDEHQAEAEGAAYWRSDRLVFRTGVIMSLGRDVYHKETMVLDPTHHGFTGDYCVDAAQPPLAPFVLLVDPNCGVHDCILKCCKEGQVMANQSGSWQCEDDAHGNWSPETSSFARYLHPETPYEDSFWDSFEERRRCVSRGSLLLTPGNAKMSHLLQRSYHHFLFSSWQSCTDFQRLENGSLAETLFYCEESQISRGVYWLLQPLCIVSTSLLIIALLSIVTNRRIRRKAHGWCLVSHATCLLGFNLGQVAYYLSLSDEIDTFGYAPEYFLSACFKFAWPMYFLLNAANCWLTALCLNMAVGFRKLQVARLDDGGHRMKFVVMSAVSWGLPALMTGLSVYAFDHNPSSRKWYSPTLVETRTCFNELIGYVYNHGEKETFNVHHFPGTVLFYYGPTGALIVVNSICIGFTLKKVQFLRQGNSILHREGACASRGHGRREEENPQEGTTSISIEAHTTGVDAKTIKLYMKMLLMIGAVEMAAECIVWATIHSGAENGYEILVGTRQNLTDSSEM